MGWRTGRGPPCRSRWWRIATQSAQGRSPRKVAGSARPVVSGAALLPCQDAAHLQLLFERAVGARRTGATRMNAASSRSHLVIGVTVEATSRVNGAVTRGKLSLLDLAGSERAFEIRYRGSRVSLQ